ncbi:MAG TPA: hypothetical protein VIV10_00655, partial [Gemmatimonadales bacterium]
MAMALPSLLAGQVPRTPTSATAKPRLPLMHGIATRVQGEVVMVEGLTGPNNQEGVDEADGQINQEGVDEADGQNNQDGLDEPDGLNNDGNVGDQVDQAGENQNEDDNALPAPP